MVALTTEMLIGIVKDSMTYVMDRDGHEHCVLRASLVLEKLKEIEIEDFNRQIKAIIGLTLDEAHDRRTDLGFEYLYVHGKSVRVGRRQYEWIWPKAFEDYATKNYNVPRDQWVSLRYDFVTVRVVLDDDNRITSAYLD